VSGADRPGARWDHVPGKHADLRGHPRSLHARPGGAEAPFAAEVVLREAKPAVGPAKGAPGRDAQRLKGLGQEDAAEDVRRAAEPAVADATSRVSPQSINQASATL
jgi:hypothetical protein